MNAKYRVVLWEYERGWGSKPFMHRDFDSLTEAKTYADGENAKNKSRTVPDYYIKAEQPVLVDLDVVGTSDRY